MKMKIYDIILNRHVKELFRHSKLEKWCTISLSIDEYYLVFLTENFIWDYCDRVDISKLQILSEDLIRKFKEKVDFIKEFVDVVNWYIYTEIP